METLRYYFFENKVETATTEIRGWQELTQKQIENYLAGGYDIVFINDKYDLVLHVDIPFDLDFYKESKISEMSILSLEIGESIAPDYRLHNCILSKEMELNGETPIYSDWQIRLDDYKNKRIYLRDEFYRLKSLIEVSETKEQIDYIISSHKLYDYAQRS